MQILQSIYHRETETIRGNYENTKCFVIFHMLYAVKMELDHQLFKKFINFTFLCLFYFKLDAFGFGTVGGTNKAGPSYQHGLYKTGPCIFHNFLTCNIPKS